MRIHVAFISLLEFFNKSMLVAKATTLVIENNLARTAVLNESGSSLNPIRSLDTGHPLATYIHRNIMEIEGKHHTFQLLLVRVHVGIPGNERVGEFAKLTAKQTGDVPALLY